jgi:signal transduction histidine kinase
MGTVEPGGIDPFDVKLLDILAQNAASVLERIEREEVLREARHMAEEMSRLKSAFLANMSHEIRTPLTSIIGFSEVLAGLDLSTTARRFVNLISSGGQRLMDTLESVLNLSQIESGMMQLHPERVDVAMELRSIVTSFSTQAEKGDVALRLHTPEGPVSLTCDPSALQRIATNLISNALKFTRPGGRVDVRVVPDEEAVTLVVADTGVGIDEAFLPQLFEAFQQESSGLAREFEGSGLGLTITHRLVSLLEGTIDVESTKGEGTTFTVRLPRP